MASSPYTNHYYDKRDPFATGQYDGYQQTVNKYRYLVTAEYARGVKDGQSFRQTRREES